MGKPDQGKLKRRAIDILDEWKQLLLNNLDDYGWARAFPRHGDEPTLVYVAKDKRGERYQSTS